MDPTTTCCPKVACPSSGHTGQGNLGIHSCKDQRLLCTECHKTCSATQGTACSRLRTSAETVRLVVTLLAHGGPRHAVQAHLVEHPRDLGQGQADAIGVKQQGGIGWRALAMLVTTRVWLGGAGSAVAATR